MRIYAKLLFCRKRQILALAIVLLTITSVSLQLLQLFENSSRKERTLLNQDIRTITIQSQNENVMKQIQHGNLTRQSETDIATKQSETDIATKQSETDYDTKQIENNNTAIRSRSENITEQSQNETYRKMNAQFSHRTSNQLDAKDPYKVVFFIGGGKSGSTTLATYLKHDPNNWKVWDPNGQFLESGKEVCWALTGQPKQLFWNKFKTLGSRTANIALDACPRAVEKMHLERMARAFPNASYLMLVRDPVDRVISHMNDMIDRGHMKVNIDDLLRRSMQKYSLPVRLSMFGEILQNAYSIIPKNKILIIPNQDLKREPQATIDKVLKHIGANPKNITLVEANKRKDTNTYQIPSSSTLKWLHDMFDTDWKLFKSLSGLNVDTVYM